MQKQIFFAVVVLFFSFTAQARNSVSPVAIGILPPIQFPTDDYSITGLRLSALWGWHRDLYGVDIGGLGNVTEQSFVGIAIAGGVNLTQGSTTITGLQLAGVTNINTNKADVYGFQIAGILNWNKAASSVNGVALSLLNIGPHTDIRGVQVGLVNRAQTVYGLQIGLVNMAKSVHGLQIGLINFHENGLFYVAPVLNFGF